MVDLPAPAPGAPARAPTNTEARVTLEQVRYRWTPDSTPALTIDHLQLLPGESLFVSGPSGSGKSTLLGLLAGVLAPQEGSLTLLGSALASMSPSARDRFRADHVGYVFQLFNLLPYLSVIENVTLPLRFSQRRRQRVARPREEALRLLAHLGIEELAPRPVTRLSVGQQQRVAAARALIGSPELILADEPTSSLDARAGRQFIELLFNECQRSKSTLVLVSHDHDLATHFDRTLELEA